MDDSGIGLALVITVLLIALNGMLASAEIAMMGLSEHKIKENKKGSEKKAKMLLGMKQDPSNFLSTVQIGITLSGLLSGAFAADKLAKPIIAWASTMGVTGAGLSVVAAASTFLITLLMTYFMLVFGELVPKRIAMVKPEATALRSAAPIYYLSVITKPLVRLLALSTNGILHLMGIDPNHEELVTQEDILVMMHEGQQQGEIESTEVEFVSNLFEFTDLTVEDAMTHRTEIEVLSIKDSLEKVISMMSQTGYNKFPVIDGSMDKIVGMIYTKDIVSLYPFQENSVNAADIMDFVRPPIFVPESKKLVELLNEMKTSKERIAVVVDEYGGTSGIVTLMDIIEEIVGDIETLPQDEIVQISSDEYLLNGILDMEDVEDFLGIHVTGEEHDTLSGYIIHQIGYIPKAGDIPPQVTCGDYSFTIEKMDGTMIRLVRVKRMTSDI